MTVRSGVRRTPEDLIIWKVSGRDMIVVDFISFITKDIGIQATVSKV